MSRDLDMGSLKIRLKLDQLDESVKGLQTLQEEFDDAGEAAVNMADDLPTLATRLEDASEAAAKVAQASMAIADAIEAARKFVDEYGTELGLTEKQQENLSSALERAQIPFMIAAQATMALSDALEIATWAHNKLTLSMLTNPLTLILIAIAAAVVLLYLAWKNNWGNMRVTFERLWDRLQPAFEAFRRILKKLGFETGTLGEVWDRAWTLIAYVLEAVLIPVIDAIVILVEWLEKAIDAWQRFWGAQGAGTMASPTSPRFGPQAPTTTTTTTYAPNTTNVYGGVNVYGTENTSEAGMNAFSIYNEQRRG